MCNPWGIKWFISYLFILAIQYCCMFESTGLTLGFLGGWVAYLSYQFFFTPTVEERLHKRWTDDLVKKLEDEMNSREKKESKSI